MPEQLCVAVTLEVADGKRLHVVVARALAQRSIVTVCDYGRIVDRVDVDGLLAIWLGEHQRVTLDNACSESDNIFLRERLALGGHVAVVDAERERDNVARALSFAFKLAEREWLGASFAISDTRPVAVNIRVLHGLAVVVRQGVAVLNSISELDCERFGLAQPVGQRTLDSRQLCDWVA